MTGGTAQENISPWLELESDPGLFTLLVDDFGVKGVQVEEIYDLSKTLENSIFGFIFLFKWMERRGRRKAASLDANSSYVTNPNIVNNMFFAHQVVPNSCATHALLSILLNCKESKYFDLGDLLLKFQRLCTGLSPENKGIAIGNQPKLAEAHNSYAKPENQSSSRSNQINDSPYASSSTTASSSTYPYTNSSTSASVSNSIYSNSAYSKGLNTNEITGANQEIFHFICFVPINGKLYELDGLKPYPVDHGSIDSESTESRSSNWTNKFKQIIKQRLSSFNSGQQSHEIRFNLMALVPDKMVQLSDQIDLMKHNYTRLFDLLTELRNTSLNENDLNLKNELSGEFDQIKMEPSINPTCSETKPPTRQLRSSRSNQNIKEELISLNCNKNEQFEVSFLSNSENNDESKKNLAELCKLHRIESVKYLATAKHKADLLIQAMDLIKDPKEKENEIINKIKMQLTAENHGLKSQLNNPKFKTDNDENCRFKKYVDLSTIKSVEARLFSEIDTEEASYNEEREKRKKYKTDALRRKHIYDEFIVTYLKTLNENGKLAELTRNNGFMSTDNSTQINLNKSQNSPIFLQQQNGPTKKRKK